MKTQRMRPAIGILQAKRKWGDPLAHWINKFGMTTRFNSALQAAKALDEDIHKKNLVDELNRLLAEFVFTPAILVPPNALRSAGPLLVYRQPRHEVRRSFYETLEITGSGDAEACHQLLQLLVSGNLWALRRCNCGLWFCARRADNLACSVACRKMKHEKTDAYKEKRRLRRRKEYAREMQQDKFNRRLARR